MIIFFSNNQGNDYGQSSKSSKVDLQSVVSKFSEKATEKGSIVDEFQEIPLKTIIQKGKHHILMITNKKLTFEINTNSIKN